MVINDTSQTLTILIQTILGMIVLMVVRGDLSCCRGVHDRMILILGLLLVDHSCGH